MIRPKANKKNKLGHGVERDMLDAIDDRVMYEKFKTEILPALRKDLASGMKAEDIIKKYEAHAAAALITSLANPNQALAAAEKILDRSQGKPTQRTESTHRFEKLKDEELDALLKSRFTELESDEGKKDVQ